MSGRRSMASPGIALLVVLFLLCSVITDTDADDLQSDRAALLAFRAGFGRLRIHWNTSASPCTWTGVICNSGRVASLRLPAVSLIGRISPGTIGNLTALRTLSLRLNAISGPLPSDIASASHLRNLYLQGNHLSGNIPPALSNLQTLVNLNLASNGFSGGIPPDFNNLTRLRILFLEKNNLSGQIPDLNLHNLARFNVSYNGLTGSIPTRLRKWPSSSFLGMALCGHPLPACPGEISLAPAPAKEPAGGGSTRGRSHKLSYGALIGIIVETTVAVLLVAFLLIVLHIRKVWQTAIEMQPEGQDAGRGNEIIVEQTRNRARQLPAWKMLPDTVTTFQTMTAPQLAKKLVFLGGESREFSMEELLHASDKFLGKGMYGTTFKAVLENGIVITMKRIDNIILPEKEFEERIRTLGNIVHPNIVPLLAYYYSREEKLLFYEYMTKGSLYTLLHGSRETGRGIPLDWEIRYQIALAAAKGIEYIHSMGPLSIHGNIKSSNILIGESHDVRVSEHGLIQLIATAKTHTSFAGYGAPELIDVRKVSHKSDVYSFGVLLLELLTVKPQRQAIINKEGVDLPIWVASVAHEEWVSRVFDPELLRYPDAEEQILQLLELAVECAALKPEHRPSMSEVVKRIEENRHMNR